MGTRGELTEVHIDGAPAAGAAVNDFTAHRRNCEVNTVEFKGNLRAVLGIIRIVVLNIMIRLERHVPGKGWKSELTGEHTMHRSCLSDAQSISKHPERTGSRS
jgi:hypothetical protein